MISLCTIAAGLGGKVRGNKVTAPGPEAASHKVKWKRKRHTLTVYVNDHGDIRVNCHHPDQDPIDCKDWVRRRCGLPAWQPKKRTPKTPPLATRRQFMCELLDIAIERKDI